jgi:carbon monoxide dehydrogenase subunit G
MACIRKEIVIEAAPETVWAAVRDVGAVHRRLAPGFVTDVRLEGEARLVTFVNGITVRELIVDIDDDARRLAYAIVGGRPTHHNASMQVVDDGAGRSRLIWITDLLPNAVVEAFQPMIEQGAAVIRRTLERQAMAARSGASVPA